MQLKYGAIEMEVFKFLNGDAIDYWIRDQTVILSKVSYFRLLYGSEWILDPAEVMAINRLDDVILNPGGTGTLIEKNLQKVGIFASSESTEISFKNCLNIDLGPDYFIVSFSKGDFDSALDGMMQAPKSERYDACIRIDDVDRFKKKLLDTGAIKELDGKRLSEIWSEAHLGEVEYVSNEADITKEDLAQPNPFRKSPKFKNQNEVRIVFAERSELPERLTVTFQAPPGLISVVEWRGAPVEFIDRPPEELVKQGVEVLAELHKCLSNERKIFDEMRSNTSRDRKIFTDKLQYLWNLYEDKYDKKARDLYRYLRRMGYKSETLDSLYQRPFHPTFQEQAAVELRLLLEIFSQEQLGEAK